MSVVGNQAQTFLRLLQPLRTRWHSDAALPKCIQMLISQERAFGSRDRRLYRELVYTTLRHLPWIEPWLDRDANEAVRRVAWLANETPATHAFRAAFAQGAAPVGDKAGLFPAWFRQHCPEAFAPEQLDALLTRAPLWVRLQDRTPEPAAEQLRAAGWAVTPFAELPSAWRLPDDVNVAQNPAYLEGRIEIQDLGSQMILASIGVTPGERWLDACAGAGGKSLQLAGLLGPTGHVTAFDIRPEALAELRTRAARAKLENISIASRVEGQFAGVLVDAPCSGSGTWRRAPHLKWTTTEAHIAVMAARQLELLAKFSTHVAPGGRLVYATCSLSRRETEEVIERFLAAQPAFEPAPFARTFGFPLRGNGFTIMPAAHDTDGFFAASLRRR